MDAWQYRIETLTLPSKDGPDVAVGWALMNEPAPYCDRVIAIADGRLAP